VDVARILCQNGQLVVDSLADWQPVQLFHGIILLLIILSVILFVLTSTTNALFRRPTLSTH